MYCNQENKGGHFVVNVNIRKMKMEMKRMILYVLSVMEY